ncbi:ubiquinol--cytochrome-c reductase catalytic subunit rip1, partial [Coemansia sp. RSA 1285]
NPKRGLIHDLESLFYVVLHALSDAASGTPPGFRLFDSHSLAAARIGFLTEREYFYKSFGVSVHERLRNVLDAMYCFLFTKSGQYIGGKLLYVEDFERDICKEHAEKFMDSDTLSAAATTTRFTTSIGRSAARAVLAAGSTPSAKSEPSIHSGKSTVAGAASMKIAYTATPTVFKQQRFMSGFAAGPGTEKVPSFADYTKERSSDSSRAFTYFMLGASGAVLTGAAQSSVQGFLSNMAASADVLAMAKSEVDLASIPLGKTVTIKWRGKPVFIKHRTQEEIDDANAVNLASLPDPQDDASRVQKPEWLVIVGICTHLGCVPTTDSGDYGGWYCPCHGSHYDVSGRIRKGPAPLNMEVPDYEIDGDKLTVG